MRRVFGFVDGNYLREGTRKACGREFVNPYDVVNSALSRAELNEWRLRRVGYYDAEGDDQEAERQKLLETYWRAVEKINDTELRFGSVRAKRKRRPRQQKGVDVLLAVDMLVGAFTNLYEVAVLVAGDADFIPAVQEVRRRGVNVVLASYQKETSRDLISECDRWVQLDIIAVAPHFEMRL